MNTKKRGKIRFFIFREKGNKSYTGVCLDFGIVLENEDPKKLQCELLVAAEGYLKTVVKEGMKDKLLNGQSEKKYEKLYNQILMQEIKRKESRVYNSLSIFVRDANDLKVPCYA